MRPVDIHSPDHHPAPSSPAAPAETTALAEARSGPRPRALGAVNWLGLETLARREISRFVKVYAQTLAAPVITAAMFLAVFSFALSGMKGEAYTQFLAPGLVMMTVIQNAFANTSSSMMIAKIQGSIVDTLTPPLSSAELVAGFVAGGVARGLLVALICVLLLFPFVDLAPVSPLWMLFFTLAGSVMLSLLGLIAGIWAVKFDHMAAITNFIVTPLSFLSGSFYSVERLPDAWETASHYNPFFYLIDGFRFGATGAGEADPWTGAAVSIGVIAVLWWVCWRLFETGYRLKS